MNWFKRHSFEWQTSWRSWGLRINDVPYDLPQDCIIYKRYFIIGPFQMRWWV